MYIYTFTVFTVEATPVCFFPHLHFSRYMFLKWVFSPGDLLLTLVFSVFWSDIIILKHTIMTVFFIIDLLVVKFSPTLLGCFFSAGILGNVGRCWLDRLRGNESKWKLPDCFCEGGFVLLRCYYRSIINTVTLLWCGDWACCSLLCAALIHLSSLFFSVLPWYFMLAFFKFTSMRLVQ